MKMFTRRGVVAGALATGALGGAGVASTRDSLARLAADRRLVYGCSVSSGFVHDDPPFAELVAQQAGILVPERDLKRHIVQAREGSYDFSGADAISAFAERNGQQMRGHTLVWYFDNPAWLVQRLKDAPNERLMTDYIADACRHYRGRIHSWDVLNEAVNPADGDPNGLRTNSPWYQAFGEGYMTTAFHAAREADPNALLLYNDFSIESAERWHEPRRRAVLKVLETLKRQNAPIDGFGIQAHLKPFREKFDEKVLSKFLDEIAGMGLRIMVTELDNADRDGPVDPGKRDQDIAQYTRRFLDVVMDYSALIGVLTWGLSDRYSWLSWSPNYKWPGGELSRGLPYDGDLKPKLMRTAMADAFASRG